MGLQQKPGEEDKCPAGQEGPGATGRVVGIVSGSAALKGQSY